MTSELWSGIQISLNYQTENLKISYKPVFGVQYLNADVSDLSNGVQNINLFTL